MYSTTHIVQKDAVQVVWQTYNASMPGFHFIYLHLNETY